MKPSNVFTLLIFMLLTGQCYPQLGVTSYSVYALGINTSQSKKISGELKVFANREYLEDIAMELDAFYNFKPRVYHRFSVGLGVIAYPFGGIDPLNSLVIPVSLEIFPLTDFRRLSLLFEVAPEFEGEGGITLRNLWGIRYTFQKKKAEN